MSALESRAEILKLARLLERDPESLHYLAQVSTDGLRRLRAQATDVLFAANHGAFARLAAASRLLPVAVVATIGERAFGAELSARIAGQLDPGRAVEMAARLPVGFLAEVAVHLDPRRAGNLLSQIPPSRVAEITNELADRREYVTMGRLVGHLPSESLAAAVRVLDDGALLRSGFLIEDKDKLQGLVSLLAPARLDRIVDAAAREDLWPEALDLLSHLTPQQQADFAERTSKLEGYVTESLVSAAHEHDLWVALLPLVADLPTDAQTRMAEAVGKLGLGRAERVKIAGYVRSAGLQGRVVPLSAALAERGPC